MALHILQYLCGTITYSLLFFSSILEFWTYSNAAWDTDYMDHRSATSFASLWAIINLLEKQNVAHNSTEEYPMMPMTSYEVIFLQSPLGSGYLPLRS